jgi:hypothetical protein
MVLNNITLSDQVLLVEYIQKVRRQGTNKRTFVYIQEAISALGSQGKNVNSVVFTEVSARKIIKKLTEAIAFTDTILAKKIKSVSDTDVFTDTILAKKIKTLSEATVITETTAKKIIKSLSEVISFVETSDKKTTFRAIRHDRLTLISQ